LNREPLQLDIAVLGGGFAGVFCARELGKRLGRRPGIKVGLISEENYMVFQPMLPEVAGGGLAPRHVINPIRLLCKRIEVYKGQVESIDLGSRTLRMDAGHFSHNIPVRFQHLVLALGAEIDLRKVPGMPEHAYLMQNAGDAMRLRATVISRCEEANLETRPGTRRRLLTFVVVGGGFSGVETAGQILDMLTDVNRYYRNIDTGDFRVVLIHAREHLFPTLNRKLGEYAAQKLRRRGLHLLLNRSVKAVTSKKAYLDDETSIDTNTVVCTVGNAPHSLVQSLCDSEGLEHHHGRIITEATLRVPGQNALWAAGDCARIPRPDGGFCKPVAQYAYRQGILCGRNIANAFDGKPLKPFTFEAIGELAAIGRRDAVANIKGFQMSGFAAWWLWRTIYLMKLPGIERKLRVMLDWTLDLFFHRDVSLLNPEQSRVLTNIHLETGDRLFDAGDPPFSLYVVVHGCIELRDDNGIAKTVGPGEFFGERALTKNLPYIYNAVASEPTELTSLDGSVFHSLVKNSSVLSRIFKRTATQYKTAEEMKKLKERVDRELKDKTAQDFMQPDLAVLRSDRSFGEALHTVKARRHSSYPVVDEGGVFLGIISREDIYCALKSSNISLDKPLSELGYRRLPISRPDAGASELIEKMLMQGTNKVLIATDEGKLAGIVALLDLIPDAKLDDSDTSEPVPRVGN